MISTSYLVIMIYGDSVIAEPHNHGVSSKGDEGVGSGDTSRLSRKVKLGQHLWSQPGLPPSGKAAVLAQTHDFGVRKQRSQSLYYQLNASEHWGHWSSEWGYKL